jgi:hypothetical protein
MGMQTVPKVLVSFDHLTQLMAQEDFNEFGHCESFKSYNNIIILQSFYNFPQQIKAGTFLCFSENN